MKHLFVPIILLFSIALAAQTESDVEKDIKSLKLEVASLRSKTLKLQTRLEEQHKNAQLSFESIGQQIQSNDQTLVKTQDNLSRVSQTNDQRISELDSSLSKKSLYWIIFFIALAFIASLAYVLLGKRIKSSQTNIEEQIFATKKSLEEESVKLDTKLIEIIESQLKLAKAEKPAIIANLAEDEPDHSLALKVADEIMRINKNLSNMDQGTKGLKQLSASVKRIEDNFAANGYETPDLLNKHINPGMKVIISNTVPDENLNHGDEVITRVIKPQVNFKGVMIQVAQVEVSVGQ